MHVHSAGAAGAPCGPARALSRPQSERSSPRTLIEDAIYRAGLHIEMECTLHLVFQPLTVHAHMINNSRTIWVVGAWLLRCHRLQQQKCVGCGLRCCLSACRPGRGQGAVGRVQGEMGCCLSTAVALRRLVGMPSGRQSPRVECSVSFMACSHVEHDLVQLHQPGEGRAGRVVRQPLLPQQAALAALNPAVAKRSGATAPCILLRTHSASHPLSRPRARSRWS